MQHVSCQQLEVTGRPVVDTNVPGVPVQGCGPPASSLGRRGVRPFPWRPVPRAGAKGRATLARQGTLTGSPCPEHHTGPAQVTSARHHLHCPFVSPRRSPKLFPQLRISVHGFHTLRPFTFHGKHRDASWWRHSHCYSHKYTQGLSSRPLCSTDGPRLPPSFPGSRGLPHGNY